MQFMTSLMARNVIHDGPWLLLKCKGLKPYRYAFARGGKIAVTRFACVSTVAPELLVADPCFALSALLAKEPLHWWPSSSTFLSASLVILAEILVSIKDRKSDLDFDWKLWLQAHPRRLFRSWP